MAIKRADKPIDDSCLMESFLGTGKTKLFAGFVMFYLQCGLYILMTGLTDVLADIIVKQLSEIINDSLVFNLNLLHQINKLQNKEHAINRSPSSPSSDGEET